MNVSDVGAFVPGEDYRPFLRFCQYYFGSTMDYTDDGGYQDTRVWPADVDTSRPSSLGPEPRLSPTRAVVAIDTREE